MPKILIVDDEEKNRLLLENFFELFGEEAGIELVEAQSGSEAIEIARREKPDLIFMDVKMESDYAGLDATRIITHDPDTAHIPVWAVTSQAMEAYDDELSDRAKSLEAGCKEYFSKPFDAVVLIQKISKLLNIEIPAKTRMRMGIE